jgi:citrate synthase
VVLRTGVGTSTTDSIVFMGRDLCEDILGKWDLGGYAFVCVTGREANDSEARLVNAVMLASADHGFTPSSIAARLTFLGAPEAIQGAIAAGILGAGSVYLGANEQVGRVLIRVMEGRRGRTIETIAKEEVERALASNERLPGFGHPIHRPVDPRTPVLFGLAESEGYLLEHCQLMQAMHEELERIMGRQITLNAAGASGAILCDMGLMPSAMRLLAIASRAIGLMSQLREEEVSPVGQGIWDLVRANTEYLWEG